jgi:hypothetical protein
MESWIVSGKYQTAFLKGVVYIQIPLFSKATLWFFEN